MSTDDRQTPLDKIDFHDLKKVLNDFPDVVSNFSRLRAVLNDLYHDANLEIGILCSLVELGIVTTISKKEMLTHLDVDRFVNIVDSRYGTKKEYVVWGVKTWTKTLGIKCDDLTDDVFEIKPNNIFSWESKEERDSLGDKSKVYHRGEAIVDDDILYILYRGLIYNRLDIVLKNKTFHTVAVMFDKAEIDEHFVTISSDKIILPPEKIMAYNKAIICTSEINGWKTEKWSLVRGLKIHFSYEDLEYTKHSDKFIGLEKTVFIEPLNVDS